MLAVARLDRAAYPRPEAEGRLPRMPVEAQQVAQSGWQRQRPVADRSLRKGPVNQVRGGLRHPSAAARRVESRTLAAQGHQPIVLAGIPMDPHKPLAQKATVQEPTDLPVYERRQPMAGLPRARHQRGECARDRPIQHALLRAAPRVLKRRPSHITVGTLHRGIECGYRSIWGLPWFRLFGSRVARPVARGWARGAAWPKSPAATLPSESVGGREQRLQPMVESLA